MIVRRPVFWILAAALWVAGAPLSLRGQAATGPDTLPVDSAQIRIRNQLRALAKPPGVDSSLIVDTLAQQRARQTQTQARPATDSIMAALLELPGYTATRYAGTTATFATKSERLVLEGTEGTPARLEQPGQTLTATDTITYDDPRGMVWTAGATTTERPGEEPVTSESIIYSLEQDRGSAVNARTSFRQGGTWIMEGDLPSIVPDTVFGHQINFTSCQETVPHYHFAATEAKVIGGGWMVLRNVTLNFSDVPVFWLPFIFQNTESGRSSGILTPRFSITDIIRTSRGQARRISNIGFFWAINDYADATIAMDWWSGNFTSVTGGFRYNIERQFLEGQFNYRQFWRANGSRELGFDTRHSWQISERTKLDVSARFITDAGFVRQNSFDPREVTGSIDSQGGINRRFDWGSISINGNRKQFLNDDRVEMTLPQVNLSLKPITLFSAPGSQAGFFNNMTWSGSANASRRTINRADQNPEDAFNLAQADRLSTTAGLSSSLNAGALRISQSLRFSEDRQLNVPPSALDSLFVGDGEPTDLSSATVSWNATLDYQQRLVGSSTFTPNVKIDGRMLRDDNKPGAEQFVSAPSRFSLGATLKSDIYGLFPGFGSFERIRHKMSPSVTWQYAPTVVPTDLQKDVFGSGELKANNVLTLTFNQTFEAKRKPRETTSEEADDGTAASAGEAAGGPTRKEQGEIVNLLSIQTSAVTYDFTRAKADGATALDGFTTTRLRNQVSSDFLRGLAISMEHDIFATDTGGKRSFAPQLSQVNLSFQMSNNSGLVRALGGLLGRGGGDDQADDEEELEEDDLKEEQDLLFGGVDDVSLTDESSMVPGSRGNDIIDPRTNQPQARQRGSVGGWSAGITYSLSRPRTAQEPATGLAAFGAGTVQQIQANIRFRPTEKWEMTWRTAYDLEANAFNDHTIRLTRELHRWQANFDFLQTATGNWTFRFQVSLTDNKDLKFDYEQRKRTQDRNLTR
jgi:lipopolysaccharide transport LptD-like protein